MTEPNFIEQPTRLRQASASRHYRHKCGHLPSLRRPRKLRRSYEGAIYHPPRFGYGGRDGGQGGGIGVVNRGNRRENIFRDDTVLVRFWATLAEAGGKTQWEAYFAARRSGWNCWWQPRAGWESHDGAGRQEFEFTRTILENRQARRRSRNGSVSVTS